MKTQSRGLAGSVFGSTSNIEKSIHTIGDKTDQCCAWLAKSTFLRVVRFRWVLPASLGLVQALAQAQAHNQTPSTFAQSNHVSQVSQDTHLSDWLLNQPALESAYPLGLVWSTPEAKAQQQKQQSAWMSQLERLRT